MKLETFSIEQLTGIITGDSDTNKFLYRSGPMLIKLFNEFGMRDIYDGGLIVNGKNVSRKNYTKDRLNKINGTSNMGKLILRLVDDRVYFETDYNVDEIAEDINNIIKYDNYKLKKVDNKYYIEGEELKEEIVSVEPHFEDIQKSIIDEIRKAKYMIWIAVAWFTDPVLYDELKKKKNQGVNIRLIISNDSNNKGSGLNYDVFETYKVDKFGAYATNIMHNKFCIIDLKTVIHGSYNWTKSANYHDEQITTDRGREIAEKFSDRFIELINK